MSDAVLHPILPTAQAVKAAMDAILAKARLALDVSPYLDEKGRLPFANLLPLLQALPDSEPATKADLLKAMSFDPAGTDGDPMGDLISAAITAIADDARIACNGIVSLPNCTTIGAHAFATYAPVDDDYAGASIKWRDGYGNLFASRNAGFPTLKGDEASFAKVEALGEWALAGAFAANYVSFPLVKTVPARAFCGCEGDVTLPAVTAIAADAFAPLVRASLPDFRRVTTLRLPYITEENVKAMPGYPFGMETYMFWKVKSTTRIICRGNTVIVPTETKVIQ